MRTCPFRRTALGICLTAVSLLIASPSRAQASTILDFETVATGNLNGFYGGVNWGTNQWVAGGYGFLPYPVSPGLGNQAIYFNPGQGSAMSFSFLTPQVFSGAWFSGPGTYSTIFGQFVGTQLVFNLYDSSNTLVHTSGSVTTNSVGMFLDPFNYVSGSAQFLASGYALPVSTVQVVIANIGNIANNSSFIMDGVTFDSPTAAPVPEPTSLALLAGGFVVLCARRARRRR